MYYLHSPKGNGDGTFTLLRIWGWHLHSPKGDGYDTFTLWKIWVCLFHPHEGDEDATLALSMEMGMEPSLSWTSRASTFIFLRKMGTTSIFFSRVMVMPPTLSYREWGGNLYPCKVLRNSRRSPNGINGRSYVTPAKTPMNYGGHS